MAVTFTPSTVADAASEHIIGDLKALTGTLTFSGSYATGGDSLDLAAILKRTGLGKVYVIVGGIRGHTAEFDETNKKLKLYSSANTELAAGAYNAALTASPVPIMIIGR